MAERARPETQRNTGGESNLARDHLANERTFLAWVRTGVALVVFGFAIGRFAIAIRQFLELQGQGRTLRTAGLSAWFGAIAMLAGVALIFVGLFRYHRTRNQLEAGRFVPEGFLVDLVGILVALFGLGLAGYLVYIQLALK